MKNSEVAKVFADIADLLELKGENVFKIRAYQRAVRSIDHLPVELERLVTEDRLREVPGVGEAIAKKITELVNTGKLDYYEELKKEFPEGISTLLDVPGIGPKTAMLLSNELGISSIMVEGGGRLIASLARAKLIDRMVVCVAPKFLGGGGIDLLPGLPAQRMQDAMELRDLKLRLVYFVWLGW